MSILVTVNHLNPCNTQARDVHMKVLINDFVQVGVDNYRATNSAGYYKTDNRVKVE